jgi:predicted nucleic acid-binding protein
LIALAKLGELRLLPALFGQVLVSSVVIEECLTDSAKPGAELIHQALLAGWLTIRELDDIPYVDLPMLLDDGEAAALRLAYQLAEPVLIDDKRGRSAARKLHLSVIGLCGVLVYAKQKGLIARIKPLLDQLQGHGYYLAPALVLHTLSLAREGM